MAKQTQLTVSDLAVIQKFFCDVLAEPGSRLTTADIYVQTKDVVSSNLDSYCFRSSLSDRIKDGTLAGIVIKKGRYGGVSISDLAVARATVEALAQKAEDAPDEVVEEEEDEPDAPEAGIVHAGAVARAEHKANALTVHLNKKLRIYPIDKYNWAIQKLSGTNAVGEESWLSCSYHSTLDQAMRSAARSLLDKRLRGSAETVNELKELSQVVLKAEESVLNEIKTAVQNIVDQS